MEDATNINQNSNESGVIYSAIQEKMPFCLSLFTGLFFIATPTFIGLNNADFAALNLNVHLTNDQLFIAELFVCIAFTILTGIGLYKCPEKRYSQSMEKYVKLSDKNTIKCTAGIVCLYFLGISILFNTLNIYFLPRFAHALSTHIWSWQTIGLLTIIGSGLVFFPILLQHAIQGTRNKAIVLLLAYLCIVSGIALHVLPNGSLVKSGKIINIMYQVNFYASITCSVALLFLVITSLVLNYNSKSRFSTVDISDNISYSSIDAPNIQNRTKCNTHNGSDRKITHHEKKIVTLQNFLFERSPFTNYMTPNLPPPINDEDNNIINSKGTEQRAGYYHDASIIFFS